MLTRFYNRLNLKILRFIIISFRRESHEFFINVFFLK